MGDIDIIAEISDMKIVDYRNTLALASLIEVLIEKGVIGKNDVALKARELDGICNKDLKKDGKNRALTRTKP
ncbi:hypothetical protein D2962_01745 [Biomaibacter acetigenes]|jgi:hypothetical protein|uniref:Uncharacterized protein n=1 Tax=Biomaibacter acetigenes TaxID=2316383 RepID=A0A3G2R2C7_9FIRM|nr:hypothetical protein [Biomaibacter acetigenes]AYO29499.1 hypothetical protein D2962_01745 [Biomaibacter acetigenes]